MGIAANYANRSILQKRNVAILELLGGQFHARQGSFNQIQVWYDDDLQWNPSESRYEIAFNLKKLLGEEAGLKDWVAEKFGRDYVYSPLVLEIDCHDFEKSPWNKEMVEQIRKLPTVRQICVKNWVDSTGKIVNEITNDDLKQIFPNLIVASPQ